jgi:homocysteine S-methyltransferase
VTPTFEALLARPGVVLVDGALATELEARGEDLSGGLWSARVLRDAPGRIQRVHHDYLAAGADCVITASYQATVEGLVRRGASDPDARAVLKSSVDVACAAREAFLADARPGPFVAASVGPYGAFLADGSEYRGDYDLDEDGLVAFHAPRLRLLAQCPADVLACETIPSAAEARALVRALRDVSMKAWLSFSCRDDRCLWDGTPLEEIASELSESPSVLAIGVNCTAPRHIDGLVRALSAASSAPMIVYPNSGEGWDARVGRWRPASPQPDLVSAARGWIEAGVKIIGGCCRTTPGDIARLRALIDEG